jgi:predicted nucleotidyltransferase
MEPRTINKLKRFFALQPIEKAWLFGSYSRGEETNLSDVDIREKPKGCNVRG